MMHTRSLIGASVVVLVLAGPAAGVEPRFNLTVLPNSSGGAYGCGLAVNARGVVVGEIMRAGQTYPVAAAWTDGQVVELTGTGQSNARATAVTDAGVVVGQSDQLGFKAFVATLPGAAAVVPGLGSNISAAYGVTAAGDITGTRVSGSTKPFVMRGGVLTMLPTLGAFGGAVYAMSPSGNLAGYCDPASGSGLRAVRWINDQAVELPGGASVNIVYGINDEGWAVGYVSGPPYSTYEPTVWTTTTSRTYLGTLSAGSAFNYAYAINNQRAIVGTSGGRAFLWEDGVMRDLNAMVAPGSGWVLVEARGINDRGYITGRAASGSVSRAFVLVPRCGSADFDGDGDVGTDADIQAFFACLGGNCCAACGTADFDGDGDTGTDFDIQAFFRVLGGGGC